MNESRSGQARPGQARPGQARPGQARPGQARPGQARPGARFRPEILAPAGNLVKLKTAVRYGADAVYLAGRSFGLRSAAGNFSLDEIERGCRFAHEHGTKVYLVLNAFLFDEELARLPAFLAEVEPFGIDAFIVSDLGVVETVRAHSAVPIHLSTQASVVNSQAARFWQQMGVRRFVLGREVSIEQAGAIKAATGAEVELFVHGAMCMAFSGNCTISNYTAGRDSNRGGCIQSCRFSYRLAATREEPDGPQDFFFSSKDLQGVAYMDLFAAHRIDSLKIEGRMKSDLYVATTVRAYVAARDRVLAGTFAGAVPFERELNAMSHRGYTAGNLVAKAGADSVQQAGEQEHGPTHEMVGHILERRPGRHLAVLLKNPLAAGEPVELLTPAGDNIALATDDLRDLSGRPIVRAAPNHVVLIRDHAGAARDLLLRKVVHAALHAHSAAGC